MMGRARRWRVVVLIQVGLTSTTLLAASPALGAGPDRIYRYVGEDGRESFTNDLARVPPQQRRKALQAAGRYELIPTRGPRPKSTPPSATTAPTPGAQGQLWAAAPAPSDPRRSPYCEAVRRGDVGGLGRLLWQNQRTNLIIGGVIVLLALLARGLNPLFTLMVAAGRMPFRTLVLLRAGSIVLGLGIIAYAGMAAARDHRRWSDAVRLCFVPEGVPPASAGIRSEDLARLRELVGNAAGVSIPGLPPGL